MKSILKDSKKAEGLMYLILSVLLLFSFYSLIINDPITRYDDHLLLGGVENLHSFSDYQDRILSGKILDIQPVRDLSYLIDFKIKSIFPLYSFHLMNLILWFVICFLFKNILDLVDDEKDQHQWLIWSLVFLYALSPVFASSVAWISGRKHLLSTLFTLWATFLFLKKKKSPLSILSMFQIAILYLLAVCSHPINVLWPVFVFVYSYFDQKINERRHLLLILFVIAILALSSNLYYYGNLYEKITAGDGKFDSAFGPGLTLLALGRYFYLSLFTFDSLPVSHFQGSIKNMIGLILMIVFLFWVYKKRISTALTMSFIIYFFLPLIPVTYKITRIFCSDTYLLNASIGLYAVIFLLLKNIKFKYVFSAIFFYAGILFFLNLSYIQVFQSTESIFKFSYAKEPTPMSIVSVADFMIKEGQYESAQKLLDQLEIMDQENRFLFKLKSDVIYLNPKLNLEMKIKNLELSSPKVPIDYLRLALLYSNQGNAKLFQVQMTNFLLGTNAYIKNSYLKNEEVVALVRVSCEKNKIEAECKRQFDLFSKRVIFNNWQPELYKSRYYKIKENSEALVYE